MKLTVNGEESPAGALEAEINGLMGRFRRLSEEEAKNFGFTTPESIQQRAVEWGRENIVERMLLRQEALKNTEPVPDEVIDKQFTAAVEQFGGEEKFKESGYTEDELRKDVAADVKRDQLVDELTAHLKPPKSKEVAEFYRKHRDQFRVPESVHAAHILKKVDEENPKEEARKAIDAARAELDAGTDFAELAGRVSDAPNEGGNLGWFPRGRMAPRFEEAAFETEPGSYSEVFKTTFGYHIVKVIERRTDNVPALAEVKDLIEREIQNQKQNEVLEAFVDKLREKATVEFDPSES
jgi:peptidyl-prolyl cis-trans isomerase C